MSDTHLANSAEARTPTGALVDQTPTPVTPSPTPTPEPKPTETPKEPTAKSTEAPKSPDQTKSDTTLLNQKDKEDKKEAPKPEGAPEKYEAWKLPEGFEANEEMTTKAEATFKELGLNQAAGQKLIDLWAEASQKAAQAPFDYWKKMNEDWQNEVKLDPEIGSKLPEVRTATSKLIDGIGDAKLSQSFREAMDLTGAGNHPAFIKLFYKLAQQLTEGTHVPAGGPSRFGQTRPGEGPPSMSKSMYPNLP